MRSMVFLFYLFFVFLACMGSAAAAEAPNHFYNPPENLHADPNYVPGEWPLPEVYAAKAQYQIDQSELLDTHPVGEAGTLYTLGIGSITASVLKNETVPVAGTFRNYTGIATVGPEGLQVMDLILDVNSFDTGVPGRNNRILAIFFESMKPELGTVRIRFDRFNLEQRSFESLKDGDAHDIKASGQITLNEVTQELSANLEVSFQNGTWTVKTKEPVTLLITDFNFGNRIYELMKECNHASMGNVVEVNAELYLR